MLQSIALFDQKPQPSPAGQPEQVAGLVDRVTFHNEESGFCVLRNKARGRREVVIVVDTLPEVRAGEWMEAQGRWIVNEEYGRQCQAEILRTTPPTAVEGIEEYPASGMIMSRAAELLVSPSEAGEVLK